MDVYLPDTNILIYAYNGISPYDSLVTDWINSNSIIISSIVAAEFLSGGDERARKIFQNLVEKLDTIAIDTKIAYIAAAYKREYTKSKPSLKLPDCLIAATAKQHDATLVTANSVDFPMKDIKKIQPKTTPNGTEARA